MWTIRLLGGLAARRSGQELTRFRTQKAASLLAYLAFHAGPSSRVQPRELLIELLWPEAELEAGRHNLSNGLSFLRRILEPPGVPPGAVLLADRASVCLNPTAVTTDIHQFESAVRRATEAGLSNEERLPILMQGAELYGGPLLPGFYDDWIGPHATRLSSLFVDLVGQAATRLVEEGRPEEALRLAERAVTADPLSESATRCLMQALAAMGQPSQALRAYRQLETRLRDELDAAPAAEMQNYARELLTSPKGEHRTARGGREPERAAREADERERAGPTSALAGPPFSSSPFEAGPSERLRGGEFLLRTTTLFFDREEEVAWLAETLSAPRTRLVTLTGPGAWCAEPVARTDARAASSVTKLGAAQRRKPG